MTGALAPRATEHDVIQALHARYGEVHGNGRRYAVAGGVRSRAGAPSTWRTCDFIAMDLWVSKGNALHGHEVKVSRSDWLRELAEPEKAAGFIPYVNYWHLVVSDPAIVRDGELPDGWGLMILQGARLVAKRAAARRDAEAMAPARLAALLRAVAGTSANRSLREHGQAYHCHRQDDCGTRWLRCCCTQAQGEASAGPDDNDNREAS